MILTDIKETKAGRFSIFVDDEFLFAVERITLVDKDLRKGMEVDHHFLSEVLAHSKAKEAKAKAYNLLSQRSYTKKALSEKLIKVGGKELASNTVTYMEELGLVDDLDYAIRYSRELYERKFYPPKRIAYELKQKGISEEGIEEALEQFDREDNASQAAAFIRKKRYDISDQKGRKRAFDAILRLGYSFGEAKAALGIYEEEFGEEPEEDYGY